MSGTLYVVGTPIGNLEDLSPRAKRILDTCDFIAAEDTRVTLKLLSRFDIKKELISYFEHNKSQKGDIIIKRLLSGESCALVSDAGMPAISDPGEDLINQAHLLGIKVEAVPGPTAFATALSISGMPSGRFCFEGFLSVTKSNRKQHLEDLKEERRTMIFYEAPHKLINTLSDMLDFFGDREVSVVKEITKIHETVFRTTLGEALKFYTENPPKGEYVIILSGAKDSEKKQFTLEQAVAVAKKYMDEGLPVSLASKTAAGETGIKKGDIYRVLTTYKHND